jgi:hypothetical protein
MKERPILFNGAMVRAILEGRKTMTRRIVKPAPQMVTDHKVELWDGDPAALMRLLEAAGRCPFGRQGDRLWVREAFAKTRLAQTPDLAEIYVYRDGDSRTDYGGPWKPSIHMPRGASRITLEITGVRVERLDEISEADARAEGVERHQDGIGWKRGAIAGDQNLVDRTAFAKLSFRSLWESINGAGSWKENPWVWVVEFKRVEGAE